MLFLICDGGKKPRKCYGSYAILEGSELSKAKEVEYRQFNLPEAKTSNEAEYHALIRGLEALSELRGEKIKVMMDSTVVVNQVLGEWNVKARNLGPLKRRAWELLEEFADVTLEWVEGSVIKEYLGH